MIELENVAACIVTKGDHDLDPIYHSIADAGVPLITIWDNSKRRDLAVYGRYAAIAETEEPLIYVQDDDCVVDPEGINRMVGTYPSAPFDAVGAEGWPVVSNMPPEFRHDFYSDHCLVGFGAVFQRDAPQKAFARMWEGLGVFKPWLADMARETPTLERAYRLANNPANWPLHFLRTCDIVFTGLTPRSLVSVPYTNLPWATADDRMYRQREHVEERQKMLGLMRKARDA